MTHGDQRPDQSTATPEIIEEPRASIDAPAGESSQSVNADDHSSAHEERTRIFVRVEREMEAFRKGEYSRFQASTNVANELGKWEGASDKEKGKVFDLCLAEINSYVAIQDEQRSNTRGTTPPASSSLPTTGGEHPNAKRVRDEVEELLDQVSGGELDGDVDGQQLGLESTRK